MKLLPKMSKAYLGYNRKRVDKSDYVNMSRLYVNPVQGRRRSKPSNPRITKDHPLLLSK